MTVRGFFRVLYDIVTYPFKQIWRYFHPRPPVVTQPQVDRVTPFILNLPRRYKRKIPNESEGKVHYRPLFMPDWFSSLSDVKNDREFKDARESARKKEERIKARKEFMEKFEVLQSDDSDNPKNRS